MRRMRAAYKTADQADVMTTADSAVPRMGQGIARGYRTIIECRARTGTTSLQILYIKLTAFHFAVRKAQTPVDRQQAANRQLNQVIFNPASVSCIANPST